MQFWIRQKSNVFLRGLKLGSSQELPRVIQRMDLSLVVCNYLEGILLYPSYPVTYYYTYRSIFTLKHLLNKYYIFNHSTFYT